MTNLFGVVELWRVEVIAHGGSKLGGQSSVMAAADVIHLLPKHLIVSIQASADIKALTLPSTPKLLVQCYGDNLLAHNGFQVRGRQS